MHLIVAFTHEFELHGLSTYRFSIVLQNKVVGPTVKYGKYGVALPAAPIRQASTVLAQIPTLGGAPVPDQNSGAVPGCY